MPITDGKYVSPNWKNDQPPAIDAAELNDMGKTLESIGVDLTKALIFRGNIPAILTDNQTIDDVHQQGSYYVNFLSAEDAKRINWPVPKSGGVLMVIGANSSANLVQVAFINNSKRDIYVRAGSPTGTLNDWAFLTTSEVLTALSGTSVCNDWDYDHTIATNGSTVDITSRGGANSWKCTVVECAGRDVFTLTGRGGSTPRLWCFTDENYTVLTKSAGSASLENGIITAPDGAAYLIVNCDDYTALLLHGSSPAYTSRNAIMHRGRIYQPVDIDTFKTNGIWTFVNVQNIHAPEGVTTGMLVVVRGSQTPVGADTDTGLIFQIIEYPGALIFRKLVSGVWTEWDRFVFGTDINTTAPTPFNSPCVFKAVGCVGDSITKGYISLPDEPNADYEGYSWPTYMSQMTGNKWRNFGYSGSSAKSWIVNEQSGDHSLLKEVKDPQNKCQAYVISLLANDAHTTSAQHSELGKPADIGTDADTFYAYYYKLIRQVHEVNPAAPLFCNTFPRANSIYQPYNQAVRDVVAYCRNEDLPVYLCDLRADYYTEQFYANPHLLADTIGTHHTAIGYKYLAECYMRVLTDVMLKYEDDMRKIHLIPYAI